MKIFKNPFSLLNKTIFILGGNGLIGAEASLLLANYGAKIIIIDKKKNKLTKNHKNINYINYNITNVSKLKIFFKKTFRKYGVPNIFINCSYPKTDDWDSNNFKDIQYNSYSKNIEIHLNSYVWSSKIICDAMKKQKIHGSVILLNSVYGLVGQSDETYKGTSIKENMTYSIIKGGLVNFTRQIAAFYGKNNIRINSICSGGIIDKSQKKQNNNFKKNYIKKTLLKRLGNPSDISGAILYLASDASNYVTGTSLVVDGGWTAV